MKDVHYFLHERMDVPLELELPTGTARIFSTRSPGKETPNEDSAAVYVLDDGSFVLAVADGVGGQRGGLIASDLALKELAAALEEVECEQKSLRGAILDGIEAANRGIVDLGIGAGTTLAVAAVSGGSVRSFHVGDSSVLLTGQRARLKLATVPHSPTGYLVEAGVIEEEEALRHSQRHIISNMLGLNNMRIEVGSEVGLAPRDTLLLASDGLFDNLHTDEILELVRKGPLELAIEELVGCCRHRMEEEQVGRRPSKPDDLTVLAFRMGRGRS